MYTIKKIILFLACFFSGIYATSQNGKQFIDSIQLNNTTDQSITVYANPQAKTIIAAGQTKNITLDHSYNYFVIRQGSMLFHVAYKNYDCNKPIGETFNTDQLDVTTIRWLAANQISKIGNELDSINLHNDMLYKIAVLWQWNKTRSRAQIAEPDETISRVVREEQPTRSGRTHGELLLSLVDVNAKKYTIPFIRRAIAQAQAVSDNSWHEVTLSAHTLIAFHNGTYQMKAETL